MKRFICMLAAILLFPPGLFAEAGLKEAVREQIRRIESATTKPGVYPEFAEKLNQIFLQHTVAQIVIEEVSKGKRRVTKNIYIKGEEVCVEASSGWNLVADSSGVYEWETGKRQGIKIKRGDEDLLAYVNYLMDPSGVMSSLYSRFRMTPEGFEKAQNKDKGWTELRLKVPIEGAQAVVYFSENPFWLHGFQMKAPDGKTAGITISKPKNAAGMPEEFMGRFKQIKFEDSGLSLKRHLVFL
ncbi:MAG TPA: hypothetical protein VG796_21175 [Verrucomicrobiales bacterium]|nr:hypothetical protein [Verrucomicrobiales bacterium]